MPGLTVPDTEPAAPDVEPEHAHSRSLTADVLPYVAVVGVAAALGCLDLYRVAPRT